MIGVDAISELRLTTLNKLITKFTTSPNLKLMSMFGTDNWESDNVEWEGQIGNRGLTPFVSPDAQAPKVSMSGVSLHKAAAAFFKEKMWFNETFLNNLREPGTDRKHYDATKLLAKESKGLRNRCDRRKEWMFAKMLTGGSFTYKEKDGIKVSVDYGVPSSNLVTLAASRKWDSGASRNIVEDIMDANITMSNNNGTPIEVSMCPSEILKLMVLDPSIQALLQKSSFGSGDLFANPTGVLGSLLHIRNFMLYDEQYQIRSWLTAAVTGSSTTVVYVDDASDYEVGATLRFVDTSAKTYEDETITAVDEQAGTVTVGTAPTASFKAREDYVYMTRKFLPTNKFCMFAPIVEGNKIAEFAQAPFGLQRNYGMYVDRDVTWDPDGIYIRVQNKGLPVLYHEDAVYTLTVK